MLETIGRGNLNGITLRRKGKISECDFKVILSRSCHSCGRRWSLSLPNVHASFCFFDDCTMRHRPKRNLLGGDALARNRFHGKPHQNTVSMTRHFWHGSGAGESAPNGATRLVRRFFLFGRKKHRSRAGQYELTGWKPMHNCSRTGGLRGPSQCATASPDAPLG
jgi:hypothetical protein